MTGPALLAYYVVVDDNIIAPDAMLTVSEAARLLGRSIEQVRRYLREGKLRGRRIGQQWFIDKTALGKLYVPGSRRYVMIREAAAVMEAPKETMNEEIAELVRRVARNREAIRRRLGGDLRIDVVELLRIDREEH